MSGSTVLRRLVAGGALVAAALGLAACDTTNLILTVNTNEFGCQSNDADPGDGVCEVTVGAGDCTLRAAIDEGNASVTQVPQIVLTAAANNTFIPKV